MLAGIILRRRELDQYIIVLFTAKLCHSFNTPFISIDVGLPKHDGHIDVALDQEPVSVGFGISADAGKIDLLGA